MRYASTLRTCLAFAAALLSTASLAADWTVNRLSGEVWIAADGVQAVSLGAGMTLPRGGLVTTGTDGRVLLVSGDQSMTIGPSSVVRVRADAGNSGLTTILQRAGVVEFNVDKRAVDHFAVETPFLAAVVKGTRFAVGAFRSSGVVKVANGRVEVTDLRTGQVVDILPGQQAVVTVGGGLQLSGSGDFEEFRQETPRPSQAGSPEPLTPGGGTHGLSATIGSGGIAANIGGSTGVTVGLDGEGAAVSVGGTGGVSVGVYGGGVAVNVGGASVTTGGLLNKLGL